MLAVIVGLLMIADAAPPQPAQPALSTTVGSTAPVAPVASAPPAVSVPSIALGILVGTMIVRAGRALSDRALSPK